MKVKINENCIGCGACTGNAEGIFDIGDDGLAKVVVETVPEERVKDAKAAIDGCPVSAIEEVKEETK